MLLIKVSRDTLAYKNNYKCVQIKTCQHGKNNLDKTSQYDISQCERESKRAKIDLDSKDVLDIEEVIHAQVSNKNENNK